MSHPGPKEIQWNTKPQVRAVCAGIGRSRASGSRAEGDEGDGDWDAEGDGDGAEDSVVAEAVVAEAVVAGPSPSRRRHQVAATERQSLP